MKGNSFFGWFRESDGLEQRGDQRSKILTTTSKMSEKILKNNRIISSKGGTKGGPKDAMHVVPPLVLTTTSKIENLVFQMKKCFFS